MKRRRRNPGWFKKGHVHRAKAKRSSKAAHRAPRRRVHRRHARNPYLTLANGPSAPARQLGFSFAGGGRRPVADRLFDAFGRPFGIKPARKVRRGKKVHTSSKRKARRATHARSQHMSKKRHASAPRRKGRRKYYRLYHGRKFRIMQRNPFSVAGVMHIAGQALAIGSGVAFARTMSNLYNSTGIAGAISGGADARTLRGVLAEVGRLVFMEGTAMVAGSMLRKVTRHAEMMVLGATGEVGRQLVSKALFLAAPDLISPAKVGLDGPGDAGGGAYEQYYEDNNGQVFGRRAQQWYLIGNRDMSGAEPAQQFGGAIERAQFGDGYADQYAYPYGTPAY